MPEESFENVAPTIFQRVSFAVQRLNAACPADTFPVSESAP